jgi:hypothetical protein
MAVLTGFECEGGREEWFRRHPCMRPLRLLQRVDGLRSLRHLLYFQIPRLDLGVGEWAVTDFAGR